MITTTARFDKLNELNVLMSAEFNRGAKGEG